jgi:hypothetical protein
MRGLLREYQPDAIGPQEVHIYGSVGLEKSNEKFSFTKLASEIIDFKTNELYINIEEATRIWPSTVTLLCSLAQWVEFANRDADTRPPLRVYSTNCEDDSVNSYLKHCGFYDYIGLKTPDQSIYYPTNEVVKIKREQDRNTIEKNEENIGKLIAEHCNYTKDEVELFESKVLIEVFLNVHEHGIPDQDYGWWVLAQVHPSSGIISLNVADNGIGIKHSMLTGPQKDQMKERFGARGLTDGVLIEASMQENISGAFNASTKSRGIFKKYIKGARRGNGLSRIWNTCKELGIDFTILSHHGYMFGCGRTGKVECGTMEKRIFAGTLYHFSIPMEIQ